MVWSGTLYPKCTFVQYSSGFSRAIPTNPEFSQTAFRPPLPFQRAPFGQWSLPGLHALIVSAPCVVLPQLSYVSGGGYPLLTARSRCPDFYLLCRLGLGILFPFPLLWPMALSRIRTSYACTLDILYFRMMQDRHSCPPVPRIAWTCSRMSI